MTAPRPTVTDEMIRAAVLSVVSEMAVGDPESAADSVCRQYRHPMDGFDLAMELKQWESWDISRDEMEELDAIESRIGEAFRDAEKAWGAANPMLPPLPIGTKTTRGTIAGIYEYQPAYYMVKGNDCQQDGRFLLLKFEDARSAA